MALGETPELTGLVDPPARKRERSAPSHVEVLLNPASKPGTKEWFDFVRPWVRTTLKVAAANCKPVAHHVVSMRPYVEGTLGRAWREFCVTDLDADPAWIDKLIEGVAILEHRGHDGPVTQAQAVAAVAERAEPAGDHGGKREGSGRIVPGRARPDNQGTNSPLKDGLVTRRGPDTVERLTARIARDAPAVLADMKAGKYPSVRKAAIAAGIVKPKTPMAQIESIAWRMSLEDLAATITLLTGIHEERSDGAQKPRQGKRR